MPPAETAAKWEELALEERRGRRQFRREQQRQDNIDRAAKMHTVRLRREAERREGPPELKPSIYVGCAGWRYWQWRDSFYADVPQENWFEHYSKRFDTVEINASLVSARLLKARTGDMDAERREPGLTSIAITTLMPPKTRQLCGARSAVYPQHGLERRPPKDG